MRKIIEVCYKWFVKPILFRFSPDTIHINTVKFARSIGGSKFIKFILEKTVSFSDESLRQNILGMNFRNPVGLAAGFDKDGDLVEILPHIGFGFMQVGSITHKSYAGNPQPWSHRLPDSKSLVVNYGLKNIGAKNVLEKVALAPIYKDFPISFSVAKTNCVEATTLSSGTKDYYKGLLDVVESDLGNFVTINISCPNVFGGEPFTDANSLRVLLGEIKRLEIQKPIFIKMPINLPWDEFKELLDAAISFRIDGVIVGNLNKDRSSVDEEIPSDISGSLSGLPTQKLSNEKISKTYEYCGDPNASHGRGKLVIIGVGGIFSAEDAYEKIKSGASLVQLITGMIYMGPQLVGQINKGLVKLLQADGYENISEAVGAYHR